MSLNMSTSQNDAMDHWANDIMNTTYENMTAIQYTMTSPEVLNTTSPQYEDFVTSNTSDAPPDYYYYDYDDDMLAAHNRRIYTKFYMLGVILPFGLFFNTFAFCVFLLSPNINKTTTGRFLMTLTIADNMFLIGEFLRWLNTADTKGQMLGLEFAEEYLGWCGTIYFIRYYGQLVSGWLTVAITIERFIGVAFPLKANQISTKTSTHVTIALIYVISAAVTCFPYWTLRINNAGDFSWCEYIKQQIFDTWVWVIIRVFSILLPSALIFVFTGLIIYKLHKMTQNREGLTHFSGNSRKTAMQRQLTFMLIAVAITFLILRLPYTLTYYMFDFRLKIWGDDIDIWFEQRLWLAKDICDVIATTNYTVNFFLYCLTGSQFRTTCYLCIKCEQSQKKRMRKYRSSYKSETALSAVQSGSNSTRLTSNSSSMKLNTTSTSGGAVDISKV